jgi:hypothetical protein
MRHLEDAMNREVTRKEFLTTLGFGIASILGFSGIMKFIFGRGNQQSGSRSSMGYGGGTYGGRKTSA